MVKIIQTQDRSIRTNLTIDPEQTSGNSSISDLRNTVLSDWATRDWSNQPVGQTNDGEDVYLLDPHQIQSIAAELKEQPNVERLPTVGGYYTLSSSGNTLFLKPVDKVSDESSQSSSFEHTNGISESYWEASTAGLSGNPYEGVDGWLEINPFDRISDLSSSRAVELLKDMINSTILKDEEFIEETDDYILSVRPSSLQGNLSNLNSKFVARIAQEGSLEISGAVGEEYSFDVRYRSRFDSENYFPNQLDSILDRKAKSLFSGISFDELSQSEKDMVWNDVRKSKLEWDLSTENL